MMPDKLNLNQIRDALRDGLAQPCTVFQFDSIDSTNEWGLNKVSENEPTPFAVFAEQQTQGRGRRGKHWISPAGCNIYMSLAWQFDHPVNQLGILSLAMGLSVVNALKKAGIHQPMLKWPNDILVNDKKIAGVLIETTKISTRQTTAVIGIGLNYQLPTEGVELPQQPWTDVIDSLGGQAVAQRSHLAGSLLQECISMCERLPQENALLLDEFHQHDICNKEQVSVLLDNGEQLQGVACGVNANGEIRVLIDGRERVFNSAEISLRRKQKILPKEGKGYEKVGPC